jgi:hypothetical protein
VVLVVGTFFGVGWPEGCGCRGALRSEVDGWGVLSAAGGAYGLRDPSGVP